jgi:hypothetical protein
MYMCVCVYTYVLHPDKPTHDFYPHYAVYEYIHTHRHTHTDTHTTLLDYFALGEMDMYKYIRTHTHTLTHTHTHTVSLFGWLDDGGEGKRATKHSLCP